VQAADLMQEYEAKIAALECMVGRQALEIELLKGALKHAPRRKAGPPPSSPVPWHLGQQECELMGLSRSTFYDAPARSRRTTFWFGSARSATSSSATLPACRRGSAPPGRGREQQEAPSPDARAWVAAQAAPAICRHH